MAEEVIAFVVSEIGSAAGLSLETIATIGYAAEAAIAIGSVYTLREQQRKAQARQRDAYNSSLQDRYVMVRSALAPRTLVLGRQRVSGPMIFVGSYGSLKEHLVYIVALAAHEIDAIEAIYFDDERITLDGSGNVLAVNRRDLFTLNAAGAAFTLSSTPVAGTVSAVVKYGTTSVALGVSVGGSVVTVSGGNPALTGTVTISYQPDPSPYAPAKLNEGNETLILDGAGNGALTLAHTPVAGTVHVVEHVVSGDFPLVNLDGSTSVVGSLVTVAGSPSATTSITYQWIDPNNRARVRQYTGAPGQAADAGMIAALPGVWTSAHTMAGIAYLVIELDYDQDAFGTGIPNPSAVVRGAKVLDTRTGITAWSENPALLTRHAAISPLCGRMSGALVNDTSVSVAANVCDQSTNYLVNGQTYTRALYTAGLVHKSGTRPVDTLNDLTAAMAGRWVFVDGLLRVKAGAYVTPLQTLDETWLTGGQGSTNTAKITMQQGAERNDAYNTVTGKFADEQNDYQVLDFPQVSAAAYIAADQGAVLPLDVQLNAVTFIGQAQQVVAAQMRDARFGKRMSVLCNMRAYPVEVFDTLYVNLSRRGYVLVPFEVMEVAWTLDGGILLNLKLTDPSIWALGTTFAAFDPAASTTLRRPSDLPLLAGLSVDSTSAVQVKNSDGTVLQRMKVSWTAPTDPGVLTSMGGVEVRYGLASTPEAQWNSVFTAGPQSEVFINGVHQGDLYLVKARFYNSVASGKWTAPVLVTVSARSIAIDTPQIVPDAVAAVQSSEPATQSLSWSAGGPGTITGSLMTAQTLSYINNTGRTVAIELSATARAKGTGTGGTAAIQLEVEIAWRKFTGGSLDAGQIKPFIFADTTVPQTMSYSSHVTIVNGQEIRLSIEGGGVQTNFPGSWAAGSFVISEMSMRLTVVKA